MATIRFHKVDDIYFLQFASEFTYDSPSHVKKNLDPYPLINLEIVLSIPLQINIIKNDSLYGKFTYFIADEIYGIDGDLNKHLIHVSYAPSTGLIRVIENNETMLIVEMHNVNPETCGFFAGSRMLQNKDVDISNNKKFKLPEWYNVYLEPNSIDIDVLNYMEAVYCLFFGIGHGI